MAGTTAGKISGYTEDGIHIFKSIPYGADTAKTRFQAPVPPEKWTGVKECTRFTTMAPQLVAARGGRNTSPTGNMPTSASGVPGGPSDAGVQSEDCLHLHVFTPGLRDGKKRPVLCYFHGGRSTTAPLITTSTTAGGCASAVTLSLLRSITG